MYQEFYETAFLSSRPSSDVSWIGTFQGFLLYLIGILTGPTFDRGYSRTLISVGTILVVFGMMMASLGRNYHQIFLAQGVLVGLGAGCLFVPSVAICATYFSTRRALATGIVASGGSIGMRQTLDLSLFCQPLISKKAASSTRSSSANSSPPSASAGQPAPLP